MNYDVNAGPNRYHHQSITCVVHGDNVVGFRDKDSADPPACKACALGEPMSAEREAYLLSVMPLTADEIADLLTTTLHGALPDATMSRVFATLGAHADLMRARNGVLVAGEAGELSFEDVLPALRAGRDVRFGTWWPDYTRINRDNAANRTVFVHELLAHGWVVYPADAPPALEPAAEARNNCRRCELPRNAWQHVTDGSHSDSSVHEFVPFEVFVDQSKGGA